MQLKALQQATSGPWIQLFCLNTASKVKNELVRSEWYSQQQKNKKKIFVHYEKGD